MRGKMATFVSAFLLILALTFQDISSAEEGRVQLNLTRNFTVREDALPGTVVGVVLLSPSCSPTERRRSAKITAGDQYQRFRIADSSCEAALVVNNPLDRSIQAQYDLVVSLTVQNGAYLFTKYIEVTVTVSDVVDYPPLYNTACEIPVRRNTGRDQYFLNFAGKVTIDAYSGGPVGFDNSIISQNSIPEYYIRSDSKNCLVLVGLGAHHYTDVGIVHNIYNIEFEGFRYTTCTWPGNTGVPLKIHLIKKPDTFQPFPQWSHDETPPLDVIPDVVPAWNAKPKSEFFLFFYIPVSMTGPVNLTCELGVLKTHRWFGLHAISSVTLELEVVGCEEGKFGALCDQDCVCKNGARCHGLNGACKCALGWQGVACDIPKPTVAVKMLSKFPNNVAYIGGKVSLSCMTFHLNVTQVRWEFKPSTTRQNKTNIWSSSNNTVIKIGSVSTGDNGFYTCTVVAEEGKTFRDSFLLNVTDCPPNRKGVFCNETCACLQGATCDRWTGCECPVGWEGGHCELRCPDGTYGKDCAHKCDCDDTATTCHHATGQCVCVGRTAADCEEPCPWGTYGPRCEKSCECRTNASCDVMTGRCHCGPGDLAGKFCEEEKFIGNNVTIRSDVAVTVSILATFFAVFIARQRFWQRFYRAVNKQHFFEGKLEELVTTDDFEQRLLRWEKDPRMLDLAEMVGQGKFGHVLRGTIRNANGSVSEVAAKTVHQKDLQAHRAFYHEMTILITIQEGLGMPPRCTNIIQLHGIVTKSDPKYILLEYAGRGDLLSALRQARNRDDHHENFWGLAVDVARALAFLQELKLVHRDVAARNVLISANGEGKLADFGLSRDIYTDSIYTQADNPIQINHLPLKWMALESLRDGEFTHKTDVWAYGVLLWEIAAMGNEPVYPGPLRPDCHHLIHLLEKGCRLRIPHGCSVDMYRLMLRCWNADHDRRPEPQDLIKAVQLYGNLQTEWVEKETTV